MYSVKQRVSLAKQGAAFLLAVFLALAPCIVFAIPPDISIYCGFGPFALPGCPAYDGTFVESTVFVLFNYIEMFAVALAVLFIVVGGTYIMTSAGSDERVTTGKNTITWAVLGLFVTWFADDIVTRYLFPEIQSVANTGNVVLDVAVTGHDTVLTLGYAALLIVAIFSGMRMVMAGEKDDEMTKGRMGVIYAAVGALIIYVANRLVGIIVSL